MCWSGETSKVCVLDVLLVFLLNKFDNYRFSCTIRIYLFPCFFSLSSHTSTHLPLTTQCMKTCGTIFKMSVELQNWNSKDVLPLISPGTEDTWNFWHPPLFFFFLTGGRWNTRTAYSILCSWDHEPLDSSDGLPSGHHWHPNRNCHTEALPVGPRLCGRKAISIQVDIRFILFLLMAFNCEWKALL